MERTAAFDLVIFDCDGVLIDSEIIACRIDATELTRLGITITTEEVVRRFAGVSAKNMREIIERETGHVLPSKYEEKISTLVEEAFATDLRAIPNIGSAIDGIGVPICVASSSSPQKLHNSLKITGLYDRFTPNIFSSTQVQNGKPAPDLFLYAGKKMGVAPGRCIVIEDSAAGVKAAVSAGMRALGFIGGKHATKKLGKVLRAEGALEVFSDMDDLPNILDQLRG